MSRKSRALEKQRKQNSQAKKAKNAKKRYYASALAKETWEEKKARKQQGQIDRRESLGISTRCPLQSWEQPSKEKCGGCKLRCSFKNNT